MATIQYKPIKLYSKKLKKEIELDCYEEEDGTKILSTNSLKKVFEGLKEEFAIVDTVICDVKFNERGAFLYASAEWTIKDKFGYQSTFVGEATPLSLESLVAKKFPKTTALNRAQSAGIIAYLQLPSKMYSDAQITPKALVDEESSEEEKKDNKNEGEAGIITNIPEMSADVVIPTAENIQTLPNEVVPDESLVNDDTIFGISIYKDETVGNIIKLYKENDTKVKGLIDMLLAGKIKPENDEMREIIKYIKLKLS